MAEHIAHVAAPVKEQAFFTEHEIADILASISADRLAHALTGRNEPGCDDDPQQQRTARHPLGWGPMSHPGFA